MSIGRNITVIGGLIFSSLCFVLNPAKRYVAPCKKKDGSGGSSSPQPPKQEEGEAPLEFERYTNLRNLLTRLPSVSNYPKVCIASARSNLCEIFEPSIITSFRTTLILPGFPRLYTPQMWPQSPQPQMLNRFNFE